MYTVMIVDDEAVIRDGIVKHIDWEKNGYKIISTADNGKSALKIAAITKPDIIITDIYMPIMDGIEFAQKVKRLLPKTIIIFLSGYNEFKYAQKALEIGIFRYLTKPIKEEELFLVLDDTSKDFEHKELEQSKLDKLNKLINDSLPLLKERFFLNLVKGALSNKEILDNLSNLDINMNCELFLSATLSLDDYYTIVENNKNEDLNLIKFAIQNITFELFNKVNCQIFNFEDNKNEIGLIISCNRNSTTDLKNSIFKVFKEIQKYVRIYFKTTITVGLGNVCKDIKDLKISYNQSKEALEYKTNYGKNSIIYIGDLKPSHNNKISFDYIEDINKIIKQVKNINISESNLLIDKMFDNYKNTSNFNKDTMHIIVMEFISKIIRIVYEYNDSISNIFDEKFNFLNLLNFDTLEDTKINIKYSIKKIIDFVESKHNSLNRQIIQKAKDYINLNYYKEGLKLSDIANNIHISSGYLSQLFKQITGESCVDYITKIKINNAKKLLRETTLKVYEISEKVGYVDALYFSTCFKKIVGMPPTEYRNYISNDFLDD